MSGLIYLFNINIQVIMTNRTPCNSYLRYKLVKSKFRAIQANFQYLVLRSELWKFTNLRRKLGIEQYNCKTSRFGSIAS